MPRAHHVCLGQIECAVCSLLSHLSDFFLWCTLSLLLSSFPSLFLSLLSCSTGTYWAPDSRKLRTVNTMRTDSESVTAIAAVKSSDGRTCCHFAPLSTTLLTFFSLPLPCFCWDIILATNRHMGLGHNSINLDAREGSQSVLKNYRWGPWQGSWERESKITNPQCPACR